MKFSGFTIVQGVEFSIFLLTSEWALQQCSANALPVILPTVDSLPPSGLRTDSTDFHPDRIFSAMSIFVTGSIARSATRRYLIYSEADFEVFRPAGATRCTDGVKFGTESPPP